MKQEFRFLVLTAFFALTACGQNQAMSTGFQKASDACESQAIPTQFIVKNKNGSMKVVQAESEEAFINGYMKDNAGEIQYAEHDYMVSAKPVESSDVRAMDGLTQADNWGPQKIEVDKLWANNVRGAGIVVAVVDSGMDTTHPQLQNQIAFNAGEFGSDGHGGQKQNNHIDDDGNGYVDDYAGYDFSDINPKPLAGDNQHHGTHVSGIVAAEHSDTTAKSAPYVEGVAPAAKILPLAFLDKNGSGSMAHAVVAIQYAVARGARVINASWGGSQCSQTLKEEIGSLEAKKIVFVAAAGNDSSNVDFSMEYPASLNLGAMITVGATGDHDYMANYSNYGSRTVHIFAPGTNIVSTLPGGQMGYLSGTSMAAPFVSGASALLLGAVPDATPAQVRQALYNSAFHSMNYLNASQGRMDLASALNELHAIVGH